MKRVLLHALFVALLPLMGTSQTVTYNMANMTVQDCDGILLDSENGNNPGEYAHNENFIFTICPPGGASVTLTFSSFVTEACCDIIRFFNGPDTLSPLIGTHSGSTIPGPIVANSGCLTVHFKSDANVAAQGWSAVWQTVLNPPIPAQINAIPNADCSVSSITINLNKPVPCNQVNAGAFTITGPSGAVVLTATPTPCTGGNTSTIVLTLSPGFSNNGAHTVCFDYTFTDICDSTWYFTICRNFTVVNCPINANILAGSNTICQGQCTNLLGQASGGNPAAYTWTWSHGLPSTAGPHVVCPTTTTTYSLTVADGVSAPDLATRTITVVPKPNAGPDMTKCRLDPQSFMVGLPAGGYWKGPGIVDTNSGLFRPWVAGAGTWQLIYHRNGCTDTMIMTVLPIWAGNDQAACPGAAPFTVSGFSPAGGTWSGPFVTPAGVFNPSTIGNYTITYTAPNGCTDAKIVRVNDITVQADDTTCVNSTSYPISFSPIGGVWSGPGIVGSNWYWGVFNPSVAGVGVHLLTYTTQGCIDTVIMTVQAIQAQADLVVCPTNPTFTLSATPVGGYWTGPGIVDSAGIFDPAWNAGNNFNGVAIYHFGGCVDTTIVWVRNTAIGAVSKTFCIDDNPMLLNWPNVQRDPWNGQWTGPGVTDPDYPGTFDPGVAGGGTHKLLYTANGCIDSILMIVNDPEPQLDTTVCQTTPTFNLSSTPAGGTWSGFGIVNGATGAFNPQLTGLGNFTVYYTYPSGSGCTDSMVVTVDPLVNLSITGLDSVYCYVDVLDAVNATPAGGTLSGPGIIGNDFNPFVAGAGIHYIVYSYGSGNCAQEDSVRVRVRSPLTLSVTPSTATVCSGEFVTFNATGTGGRITNHVINWSHGLGFGASKTVNPSVTTTYTVILSDNCSKEDTVLVSVIVHPPVSVTAQPGPWVCYGDTGFVQLIPPPGSNYSYLWATNPPQTGSSISGLIGYYQATVTDDNTGCTATVVAEIQGYSVIDANFIPNPNSRCVNFLDPVFDFIDLSTGGIAGMWDFGDGSTQAYVPGLNPVHNYADTGNFLVKLYITNAGGCPDSFEMDVCVDPAATIFAPTGFTPNFDGRNDIFTVAGIGITEFKMLIYNRWGELLYETNDINLGWDGTYNGKRVENDVYTYLVLYKDMTGPEKKSLKGIVAVIR